MSKLKEERVEVIVLKDFPEPHGRALISVYKRNDGHTVLKTSKSELIDDLAAALNELGVVFFAKTVDAIFVPAKYWAKRIRPAIMERYNCHSSAGRSEPTFIDNYEIEVIDEPHRIMPESTEVSVELEDNAGKLVFRHTPTKIVPRRKPALKMSIGDDSITIIASRPNLKGLVAGLKDIIKIIVSLED